MDFFKTFLMYKRLNTRSVICPSRILFYFLSKEKRSWCGVVRLQIPLFPVFKPFFFAKSLMALLKALFFLFLPNNTPPYECTRGLWSLNSLSCTYTHFRGYITWPNPIIPSNFSHTVVKHALTHARIQIRLRSRAFADSKETIIGRMCIRCPCVPVLVCLEFLLTTHTGYFRNVYFSSIFSYGI